MKGLKKSVLLMLVGGLTLGVVGCSSSDGDKTQLEEIKENCTSEIYEQVQVILESN